MRGPPDERSVPELLAFGVVNLDKPPGPSSHQVAGWLRDMADDAVAAATDRPDDAGVERAAHAGTLDPKVTGCLPVLLGDATRAAQVFDDARKGYVAVLELHGIAPTDFESVVAEFEGPILQKPPRKSAVTRRLRERTVHALDVLEREDRRALLHVECDPGTYVRKLCHDLGLALGTGAHMGALRRVRTGTFDDAALVTMHDLQDALAFWREDGDEAPIRDMVAPAERALEHLPRVTVAANAAEQVAEGAPVYAPGVIGVADVDDLAVQPQVGDLRRQGLQVPEVHAAVVPAPVLGAPAPRQEGGHAHLLRREALGGLRVGAGLPAPEDRSDLVQPDGPSSAGEVVLHPAQERRDQGVAKVVLVLGQRMQQGDAVPAVDTILRHQAQAPCLQEPPPGEPPAHPVGPLPGGVRGDGAGSERAPLGGEALVALAAGHLLHQVDLALDVAPPGLFAGGVLLLVSSGWVVVGKMMSKKS